MFSQPWPISPGSARRKIKKKMCGGGFTNLLAWLLYRCRQCVLDKRRTGGPVCLPAVYQVAAWPANVSVLPRFLSGMSQRNEPGSWYSAVLSTLQHRCYSDVEWPRCTARRLVPAQVGEAEGDVWKRVGSWFELWSLQRRRDFQGRENISYKDVNQVSLTKPPGQIPPRS